MSKQPSLQAADPRRDASVHASAGTGKTWLLVTRVLHLLLAGARIDGILAITFTRKAAAEMEQRIMERLRELACADDTRLGELLQQAGIAADRETRLRATQLYEAVLCHPRRLRCTTFHAFCNDLLARFPIEAGVTPGFELVEKTGQLEQAAYDALLADSIRHPDHPVTQALDALADACESLDSTQKSLFSFLAQRSDWWAWTTHADVTANPDSALAFASNALTQFLDIDPTAAPLAGYPDDIQRARHGRFAKLLRKNKTGKDATAAEQLERALQQQLTGAGFLAMVTPAYLTVENEPRKRTSSKAQAARLGVEDDARYLDLHAQGCEEVLEQRDLLARHRTLALNTAWYRAGIAMLQHYQRIKQERRTLDLTDLEWLACQLLNRSAHADWVQYKLDARIDHLLIDEFQDTNPTQWRLLLPLLQELAAGDAGRERSVFLVGDRKQSIYRFRRANPALLETASQWLEQQRGATRYPLNRSRRSAQAIMECVNRVFGAGAMADRLAEFVPHDTYLDAVYGQVELLPLCTGTVSGDVAARSTLRNPLHEPRTDDSEKACVDEGRQIASTIRQLLATGTTVEKDGVVRTLDYADILILLRQRTNAAVYEQALREAGIPCLGASRGLLLDNLEVRDLVALLEILVSPFDNLALAQVLRSPLFGLASEQLLPLAEHAGTHWYARLQQLAENGVQPYAAIHGLLSGWRIRAGQLPVHDLLDRIFHEGEVLQRYTAAFPDLLMPRVRASFTRFIELALEIDNGRYPSLPRFLDQLARLRQSDRDQPDESAPDSNSGARVRLLTVHAAKGLEAPVVFLADAARLPGNRTAWNCVVDWPPDSERPQLMLLAAKKTRLDSQTGALLARQAAEADTEDANLLYVALTRARQYLYISGSSKPGTANTGWYGALQAALADAPCNAAGHASLQSGLRKPADPQPAPGKATVVIRPELSRPMITATRDLAIAPSRLALASEHTHGDPDGRERGIAIHAMLECLAQGSRDAADAVSPGLANALQRMPDDPELQAWWEEACRIIRHPSFAPLFDAAQYSTAYNEAPVQYLDASRMVHGVIDRLVLTEHCAYVIDYKTHRQAGTASIPQLVEQYREQMACYAQAARLLWPGRRVRPGLLFTASAHLAWLDELS